MGEPRATVSPHGTVVTRIPGPPGRPPLRVLEVDPGGTPLTALEWDETGRLRRARVRIPDASWVGIEPGTAESPLWGRSDRLWRLAADPPFSPLEPLTIFQSVEWGAIAFIPPLAEPARLPPGAGSAVLNLLAWLLADQGTSRVSYRGPYATEQLFTSLLESFRYDPSVASPLEAFLHGDLDWTPAPHERRFTPEGAYVQIRDGVEKVVFEGRAYYRRRWQDVLRDEPRVVREDGDSVVCSLWAMGEVIEDHLALDRDGDVLAVLPIPPQAGTRTPFSRRWRSAVGELIAQGSTPLLRPAILDVVERLHLEWGPVAGDLVQAAGDRLVVSLHLPHRFRLKLEDLGEPGERVKMALGFAVEVAKLLGPAVRGRAQGALAALPEADQRAALELAATASETPASTLATSLSQLVQALVAGSDLPA